jgi:hypothetical protein
MVLKQDLILYSPTEAILALGAMTEFWRIELLASTPPAYPRQEKS